MPNGKKKSDGSNDAEDRKTMQLRVQLKRKCNDKQGYVYHSTETGFGNVSLGTVMRCRREINPDHEEHLWI